MAPGSMLMIHDAWTICCGDGEDMLAQAALLEKIDGTIAATYAAKGKGDAAHYASLMDAETWFTPEEALAEGLCDTVIEETPSAKPKAWNLAAFANAPQAAAEPEVLATPEPAPEPVQQFRNRSPTPHQCAATADDRTSCLADPRKAEPPAPRWGLFLWSSPP
jgi:ATP-dependent Clp protease protease subunit